MKERYDCLDGIRTFSAIGIVLMHVMANGAFDITGFCFESVVPSFTNLVFLFMMISAFSMCCGYYERIRFNTCDLDKFYKRRYQRVLPFFALLCTIELVMEHSLNSLYEWFTDLTLAFGLLPNAQISVVGVGWFLGVIFAFYMIFPFFVFLIGNKRRACGTFLIAIILNILCQIYFFDDKHVSSDFSPRANLVYCFMFFVGGGLIYLYRNQIKKANWMKYVILVVIVLTAVFYYAISASVFTMLFGFLAVTIFGVLGGGRIIFQNRVAIFISSISMEIYLSHMFVFRILEKMKLLHVTSNEIINYVMVGTITVCGAVIFSCLYKKTSGLLISRLKKNNHITPQN